MHLKGITMKFPKVNNKTMQIQCATAIAQRTEHWRTWTTVAIFCYSDAHHTNS